MDAKLDIDTSVWFPDAEIPALKPYGLERVPGFRLLPGAVIPTGWRPTPGEPNPYEDTAWRRDHKAWAFELRDVARPWIHQQGNTDPAFAVLERQYCRRDPNYFGAVYGWIQDPQPLPDEEQDKPYAKFAYQCHNTNVMRAWTFKDRKIKAKIWRTKSRQLGISWDDEHYDLWFYLTQEGAVKLASRSEDWVDNGLTTEAMFGKIKYILTKIGEYTPFLLPSGYSHHKLLTRPWYSHKTLINPVTRTELRGESTTAKVARGGTYTYARLDEDAFVPNLEDTLTSIQGAAPRIFLASTESLEVGPEHLAAWQSAKREHPSTVLEFNWHQNAYLDLAWEQALLASMLTEEQKQGAMREYFRDPFAGFGTWVYPEARDLPDANQPYNPDEPFDTTLDAAGTGDDMALMGCQATVINGNEGFHVLFGYERKLPNPERIAHILTGIWPSPGDACHGWQPDTEERELGRFYYDAWVNGYELRFFMDPAADQVHSKISYWTMLRDKTGELRQREYERLAAINIALEESGKRPGPLPVPKPIAPKFEIIKKHRLFGDREFALRRYLPFVTFQIGVKSAARVRECWGRTRYNDEADRAVTAPKRRHDQYSHQASNGEHYAIYYSYRFVDPLDTKAMRKLQKRLGLRGPGGRVPSGFGHGAVPKGFGANRIPSGFRGLDARPAPLERTSTGGWNR